ncbi:MULTISPECIES: 4-hydroxy-tetrahydrodipicolinate reductase [Rhodomicrobium]|uniref:4-hydroxy-tetrahydrodipicolinate reductase n=1 Tax=Rhodomicrobium TaxID=1068 RepID=UPI000B4AB4F0|nr:MULTISPECIES: 4-hydroxy-tetrahydrodipicolinate reductase [Rhodomicrobium]
MKLAIMGAAGRMGQALVRIIHEMPDCAISGGTEPAGSPHLGADIGEIAGVGKLGIPITDDPLELYIRSEGVLDFTTPEATAEHAGLAAQARIVHVIGTTGLSPQHQDAILAASRHAVIIESGNFSLGVNLLEALVKKAAKVLGPDYDIEVLEMHHRLKVDAPSGTALMLGRAAAEGRGIGLDDHSVRVRDGQTGVRKRGDIGFAALRGGDVIGDHSVIFAGPGERVEIAHRSGDRQLFARGALRAAQWGKGKPPGLYSMHDVLDL